jgi:hypothetical protein
MARIRLILVSSDLVKCNFYASSFPALIGVGRSSDVLQLGQMSGERRPEFEWVYRSGYSIGRAADIKRAVGRWTAA